MAMAPSGSSDRSELPLKRPPIDTASWCYRDKEEDVHHDFAWTITNFSRKMTTYANGSYIESDKFYVKAHGMDLEWQLCLYPSGKDSEDEDHVSILLELVSRSLTATFSGKIEFSVVSDTREKFFRKKKSIKETDTQIGRPMFGLLAAKFIPHSLLRMDPPHHNQITPEDRLTVLCEITIDGKDVQQSGNFPQSSLHKTSPSTASRLLGDKMAEDLTRLLESAQFSDLSIKIGSEEVAVHKNILVARSPVFAAMFSCNMSENVDNTIKIEDLDMPTVKDMLRYIYSGKIDSINLRSPHLLEAADKYQLTELKDLCEEYLSSIMNADNCLQLFVLSDMHNAPELKSASLQFIVEHSHDFIGQIDELKKYPDLMAELFKAMAKSPPAKRKKV